MGELPVTVVRLLLPRLSHTGVPPVFVSENKGVTQTGTSTTTFEALRGRLFGLAYRMLGSRADAEDIVQEAYVRWHEVDEQHASRTPRRGS